MKNPSPDILQQVSYAAHKNAREIVEVLIAQELTRDPTAASLMKFFRSAELTSTSKVAQNLTLGMQHSFSCQKPCGVPACAEFEHEVTQVVFRQEAEATIVSFITIYTSHVAYQENARRLRAEQKIQVNHDGAHHWRIFPSTEGFQAIFDACYELNLTPELVARVLPLLLMRKLPVLGCATKPNKKDPELHWSCPKSEVEDYLARYHPLKARNTPSYPNHSEVEEGFPQV